MNIFYLDECPVKSAQMSCDKHVVKMILETAQLLCTAHRLLDGDMYIGKTENTCRNVKRWKMKDQYFENTLYKASHINHPSAKWARESTENYTWLYKHFISLCNEYTYRYGKVHMTETKLGEILSNLPKNIKSKGLTEIPQAMPDYCKIPGDSVQAYRKYYILEKTNMLNYTKRNKPFWLN